MNDVIITSVSPAGKAASRAESVTWRLPRSILSTSRESADGSLDAGIHFKYDIKANKEG